MKKIIITNNPAIQLAYKDAYEVIWIEGSYREVLEITRKWIHKGAILLTHPLSSSIKPNETPYKTIIIEAGSVTDFKSVEMIENSILTVDKFHKDFQTPQWTEKVLKDFQIIDMSMIENALGNML